MIAGDAGRATSVVASADRLRLAAAAGTEQDPWRRTMRFGGSGYAMGDDGK